MHPLNSILSILLFTCTSCLGSKQIAVSSASPPVSSIEYSALFKSDIDWPVFVTPHQDIPAATKEHTLKKGIRTVLVRAYPDGMLALIDRGGPILVPHEKTDFSVQVLETSKERSASGPDAPAKANLSFQIARRGFDKSFSESRAVSESHINTFSGFLVVKAESGDSFPEILKELEAKKEILDDKNIYPIITFNEVKDRAEFASHFNSTPGGNALMSPVYGIGLIQTLFTEREQGSTVLLLRPSGRLIKATESINLALESL